MILQISATVALFALALPAVFRLGVEIIEGDSPRRWGPGLAADVLCLAITAIGIWAHH